MSEYLSERSAAEYQALTRQWGVVDVSDRTQIEITGADRVSFLNGFCTNDVQRLRPGMGSEAFLTNIKGKTIGHVFIFCRLKSLVLETVPGQAAGILTHLERYLIREDVVLHDRRAEWGELFVSGDEARRGLGKALAADMPAAMYEHASYPFDATTIYVRRVPLAPGGAYLISLPQTDAGPLAARLAAAGAMVCRPEAMEIVRVEAAMPQFGRDVHDENLPQEVNRESVTISFTKGCYLGQETVARLDALGHVNRLLVLVRWDGPALPVAGDELSVGGQRAGQVTSTVWSPRYDSPLGLAYVRTPHHQPGTRLDSPAGPACVIQAETPLGSEPLAG